MGAHCFQFLPTLCGAVLEKSSPHCAWLARSGGAERFGGRALLEGRRDGLASFDGARGLAFFEAAHLAAHDDVLVGHLLGSTSGVGSK